jgi:hypothetical protein
VTKVLASEPDTGATTEVPIVTVEITSAAAMDLLDLPPVSYYRHREREQPFLMLH